MTPITNMGASELGAEMTTFLAPPLKWALAFSTVVLMPVEEEDLEELEEQDILKDIMEVEAEEDFMEEEEMDLKEENIVHGVVEAVDMVKEEMHQIMPEDGVQVAQLEVLEDVVYV